MKKLIQQAILKWAVNVSAGCFHKKFKLQPENKYLRVTAIKKLSYSFYNRPDVVQIARELLGKILITKFDGQQT